MEFCHEPVLTDQVLAHWTPATGRRERFVDGTVGGGGHSSALLQHVPHAHLLGLDQDDTAIRAAGERLREFSDRVTLRRVSFCELRNCANQVGWDDVDAVLVDLGVSSHHFDTPERGFSFRFDGPLDMRMDRRRRVTAAQLLNTLPEEEIARILFEYGEERTSRRIARAIVARREQRPWSTTGELAELIDKTVGRLERRLPAPTRTFQALRIAVNEELAALQAMLPEAVDLLRPGGRLVVISFHSLEDRIVKRFLRQEATECLCPPQMPECRCGHRARLEILTRKPLTADESEVQRNPRAGSAKLRAAEKLEPDRAKGQRSRAPRLSKAKRRQANGERP